MPAAATAVVRVGGRQGGGVGQRSSLPLSRRAVVVPGERKDHLCATQRLSGSFALPSSHSQFKGCRCTASLHAVARLRYDTAVVGKPESSLPTVLVKKPEQVAEVCGDCRSQGRVAFDTESVMEDRYETEVCLIPIATAPPDALPAPRPGPDRGRRRTDGP